MRVARLTQFGVVEMLLSSGISGIIYSLFSGQPLCILGATGPELAYTVVFYRMCQSLDLEFLPARLWEGLWTALFTTLLALTDCSAFMRHVTRFTEEICEWHGRPNLALGTSFSA